MNSLFDALPMPGAGAPLSAGAALPSLAPADDDSWVESLTGAEPPAEDEWAPVEPDLAAVAPTWEERQADVAALVAQANAVRARAARSEYS